MPASRYLSAPTRIGLVFANLLLGILPSLAFFAWVERNASLPRIGIELGWPWLSHPDWPVAWLALWNVSLLLAFGFVHSLLAQPFAQDFLRRVLPAQATRTTYVIVTGLNLLALLGLWQNTGVVLWTAPIPNDALHLLSMAIYWILLGCAALVLRRFDALEFTGLKQLYQTRDAVTASPAPAPLLTSGVYGVTRHPIYTLTLLAFVAAPFMTLDRLLVFSTTLIYLCFAVPLEERKLVARFGAAYENYRGAVPSLLPIPSKFLKQK